ncbi:MAG: heat shock protein HslJ [Rahnella inusitata]|uniref:Heat shock protein HslJ n=1 Tax=Rahnella inusitata TaxID=58169 RepID=A0ABX9NY22_9GAMM|nr:heat shock protein HslJ [Rahnella inusitata]RJT12235.1 heat shock protein HslJ [Rahnella inusitata]
MKKALFILATAMTLGACSMNQNTAVKQTDLQHHRFELLSVDGQTVPAAQGRIPEIEFGEKMHVSGKMCNNFFGQGELQNSVLTVKGLASTRMLCSDENLNKWDQVIGEVLNNGAALNLQDHKLTLTQGKHTLVYRLKDRM